MRVGNRQGARWLGAEHRIGGLRLTEGQRCGEADGDAGYRDWFQQLGETNTHGGEHDGWSS